MKRVLGLIFVLAFFGACSAENVSAQSTNDAQRIIGTWRSPAMPDNPSEHVTYVFNANGTFTLTRTGYFTPFGNQMESQGNYFVSNSKIITVNNNNPYAGTQDYYLSADGRTLAILIAGDFIWLVKQ
jgi:hypothetical protein